MKRSLSVEDIKGESSGSCGELPAKQKTFNRRVALCPICMQNILDAETKFFRCLPEPALEEEAALTDNRLLLYNDGEFLSDLDIKPMLKITFFTVFDGEGHLCPFDSGLIENDKLLFFSGYIKPIYDDDPRQLNGVPAQEIGPILEWWISGFDGGNSFLIAFSTACADYILMKPSPDYESFMRSPRQKALLTKIVIEFLNSSTTPTYGELLNRLNEISVPADIEPINEESLMKHSQFLVDQIREVDDKNKLMSTPAVQQIIQMFDVNIRGTDNKKNFQMRRSYKPTMTPLVHEKFDFLFSNKLVFCTPSVKKEENPRPSHPPQPPSPPPPPPPPPPSPKKNTFYWKEGADFAIVNDEIIFVNNFVFMDTKSEKANRIFRIEYFFQENFTKKAHCVELIKGTDTVLGSASHPQEYFFLEECSEWPICKIKSKVTVVVQEPPKEWEKFLDYKLEVPDDAVFVQKLYVEEHGLFEDLKASKTTSCGVCSRKQAAEKADVPIPVNGKLDEDGTIVYEKILWRGEEYREGKYVYLEPFSIMFDVQKEARGIERTSVTVKTDEMFYPEFYRKARDANPAEECPEPFVIGYVNKLFSRTEGSNKKFFLTVNKMYRPEDTRQFNPYDYRLMDFQLLFWSSEKAEVLFDHVRGLCQVSFTRDPPTVGSVPRFYFHFGFHAETGSFIDLEPYPVRPKKETQVKRLKTLNAFSGLGGLAYGLRQSQAIDLSWAIEKDLTTSRSFKTNFPHTHVFQMDCNMFLKSVLAGKAADDNGAPYPKKGEVEFLCGGPPCQGFSTMNRYSARDDSQYNNSMILTFLSLCDYYRPKYILMENVRNFVSYRKSAFLRHTLSTLVAMGYQCSFGVIQAGSFGVPQCRRRLFILAAAPGIPLPSFPGPTNCFYGSFKNFEFEVNGVNYSCRTATSFLGSAPYRRVRIADAILDIPRLTVSDRLRPSAGGTCYNRFLGGPALPFPQGVQRNLRDHVSKELSPLNEARIKHVPAAKGCDWRDIPNICVRLRDGKMTDMLRYEHHDRKNGTSCSGLLRGVCRCATGKGCDPRDRQENTLIPWFLVHTANRNNNWVGVYGRLDWDGVFNTVTTNPEPSGQQGKVLHPEEDRVVSVRECARAQGIEDSLRAHGTIPEKYKQVGNAVPSPVARAFGLEIRKSLIAAGQLEG